MNWQYMTDDERRNIIHRRLTGLVCRSAILYWRKRNGMYVGVPVPPQTPFFPAEPVAPKHERRPEVVHSQPFVQKLPDERGRSIEDETLLYIREKGKVTRGQLMQKFGGNENNIRIRLRKLLNDGLLVPVGTTTDDETMYSAVREAA